MYRVYQPTLPSANLYLQEKWDRTRYEEHRRKVLMATPVVDTKGFPTPTHLLVNLKKVQMEKQRQALVKKQNKIHSSKLNAIRESHGLLDNWNIYPSRSLNSGYRLQTQVEITQENGRMLDRILRRESEYRKWQSEWAKVEQLRENISRYPRISELIWEGQQKVKFLDFKKNLDIEDCTDGSETQINHRHLKLKNMPGRTGLEPSNLYSFDQGEKKGVFKSAQLLKSVETTGRGSANTSHKISCHLPKARTFIKHPHGGIMKKEEDQNNLKKSDDNFEHVTDVSSRGTGLSEEECGSRVLSNEEYKAGTPLSLGNDGQVTAVLWRQVETLPCLSDRRISSVNEGSDPTSYCSPLDSGVSPHYLRDSGGSSLPSLTESPGFSRPMSSLSQGTYVGSHKTGLTLHDIEKRSEMSSQGEEETLVVLSQGLNDLSFFHKTKRN